MLKPFLTNKLIIEISKYYCQKVFLVYQLVLHKQPYRTKHLSDLKCCLAHWYKLQGWIKKIESK